MSRCLQRFFFGLEGPNPLFTVNSSFFPLKITAKICNKFFGSKMGGGGTPIYGFHRNHPSVPKVGRLWKIARLTLFFL